MADLDTLEFPWDPFVDALLRQAVGRFAAERGDPGETAPDRGIGVAAAARLGGGHLDQRRDAREADENAAAVEGGRRILAASLHQPSLFSALAANLSLSAYEVEVLALLLAIELAPSRQRLLAYVQDDASVTRLSLGTVRRLFPAPHEGILALARDGRLQRAQLVKVDGDGPWSTQVVAVPPSVTWAFVGDTSLDPDLPIGVRMIPGSPSSRSSGGVVIVAGGDRESRVREAQRRLGDGPAMFCRPPDSPQAWDAIVREATMAGLGVILELADRLPPDGRERMERADHLGWAVTSPSDLPLDDMPACPWSETTLVASSVPDAEIDEVLGDHAGKGRRLDLEQLRLASLALEARGTTAADAIGRLASGHLDRLATRIRPRRTWDDIILPPVPAALIRRLVDRYTHSRTVYEGWGFKPMPSTGLVALFTGPSGTGKTLAAEVVAGELGLDLYKLDLSSVVSKYIGETEKNLESVFRAAEAANVLLFFDEADSLLGKRSDVTDARDRYANMEVSYLLQRLESYDGLVVLATNMAKNIDPAFLRRFHLTVEFVVPEEAERLAIWSHAFPSTCPVDDLDLPWLASTFVLTGGAIRNVALTAAFEAATSRRPVGMTDLTTALRSELQKLGRLVHDADLIPPPPA
jgi:hypothetical protein